MKDHYIRQRAQHAAHMGTESLIILFRYLRLYHCCNVHALSNCPDHVQQQQQRLPSMVSCDRLRLLVGERKLCGNLRPVSPRAAECQCRALCVSFHPPPRFFSFTFSLQLSLVSLCPSNVSGAIACVYHRPHLKRPSSILILNVIQRVFFKIFFSS